MLTRAVETYLAVRRAAGFALRCEGPHLKSFAAFSETRKQHYISTDIAIEWAGLVPSIPQRARRLGSVIRFARYLRAEDERHEVPPAIFGAAKWPRPTPYILTGKQIQQLVTAASRSKYRICRATYSTLFSLLACTGLRVSEAIQLRFDDITPASRPHPVVRTAVQPLTVSEPLCAGRWSDRPGPLPASTAGPRERHWVRNSMPTPNGQDGLAIRRTKFRKSRLVPLHETAQAGLQRYLQQRRPYAPSDDHVFVSFQRKPLSVAAVDGAFGTAAKRVGLLPGPGAVRPRPHSLRHTFAVRALQNCPDGRDAITKHMLALSTYLGHSGVAHTYWYLEAVPDLMRDIADHAEQFAMGGRA